MEIMEFCRKVKKSLGIYVGDEADVRIKRIMKNNGIVLYSIMISEKEMNISPNIYLNGLHEAYEKGETFSEVMDEVFRIYKESRRKKSMDMDFFLDYAKMKERVVCKVISYEKNKELLRQVPYILFLDMAVVFYCHVPGEEMENATILIYDSHMKLWNITKERLYEDAKSNTPRILPPRLLSIEEMMEEIFEEDMRQKSGKEKAGADGGTESIAEKQAAPPAGSGCKSCMYVLGNERKLFGAAVMLYDGLLEKMSEIIGGDFYLLPSSLHELILIPDEGREKGGDLWKMVCEINETQVEPEDVLTDSVYYFSGKNKRLEKIF